MSSIERDPDYWRKLTIKLSEKHIITSCMNCEHFEESEEICVLVNQRPPAQTIAYGCPQWHRDLPF